jgi:hypothetical protein
MMALYGWVCMDLLMVGMYELLVRFWGMER